MNDRSNICWPSDQNSGMKSHYQYSYDNHISYPHQNGAKATCRPSKSNMLFGDALRELCQETDMNLDRLRRQMMSTGHRYNYKQMPDQLSTVPQIKYCQNKCQQTAPLADNKNAMFSTGNYKAHKKPAKALRESSVIRPCELCTSLSEHQQHIARRGERLKAKEKIKARIVFIAPPPIVKKKREMIVEKKEILYRVTVKTGTQPDAATSAKVFLTIHGAKESTQKKELSKRFAGNFGFGRGTSEVFYIKGPALGDLRGITIEHNGLEKKHSWFLEEVEIVNLTSGEMWMCVCKDWLSLYKGHSLAVKKDIKAEQRAVTEMEYDVRVITANHKMAATDANVFITFYGSRGVSKKIPLKHKSKKCFDRGKEDSFVVKISDIGKFSKIRIEHDNSGSDPSWLLEKVIIEHADNGAQKMFPCGDWLSVDRGDGETFKDLYPTDNVKRRVKQLDKRSIPKDDSPLLDYEVTVLTGNMSYAGTDANVYLQMTGTEGRAREVQLRNNTSDNFEKGQTDVFQVRAEDVGKLRKISVRHDNSGLAAGWFLEKMVIRRFFSRREIMERLQQMQSEFNSQVASKTDAEDTSVTDRRNTKTMQYKSSLRKHETHPSHDKHRNPNDADEFESKADVGKKIQRLQKQHGKQPKGVNIDSDSSELSEELFRKWEKDRLPFCDEYTFVCNRWLAEDEGDGLISKEIKPTSVTTFFKKTK